MNEILENKIASKIIRLLSCELFSLSNNELYSLLDKSLKTNELNIIFRDFLTSKNNLENLGIDLPLSFGDYSDGFNNTMVVALDPKRNSKSNVMYNINPVEISIGSIFSLHTEVGKTTKKNIYWDFISFISKSGFVYVTDVYKIYYETKNLAGQIILSNKDKEFSQNNSLNQEKSPYNQNVLILEKEIEIIKPRRIITLGKDARNAVVKIRSLSINNDDVLISLDGIEYIFLPHISQTVTQSIKTIGNLYRGIGIIANQPNITKIGENLLSNQKIQNLFIK